MFLNHSITLTQYCLGLRSFSKEQNDDGIFAFLRTLSTTKFPNGADVFTIKFNVLIFKKFKNNDVF